VSIPNITCGPGYAEPQHFLKNVLQINALKTIRQLFVDCSMASLSLMETSDKEPQGAPRTLPQQRNTQKS